MKTRAFHKGALLVALLSILLTGCAIQEDTIIYQGVERPISVVEEMIADQLEVENPGLDIGIELYDEVD